MLFNGPVHNKSWLINGTNVRFLQHLEKLFIMHCTGQEYIFGPLSRMCGVVPASNVSGAVHVVHRTAFFTWICVAWVEQSAFPHAKDGSLWIFIIYLTCPTKEDGDCISELLSYPCNC